MSQISDTRTPNLKKFNLESCNGECVGLGEGLEIKFLEILAFGLTV